MKKFNILIAFLLMSLCFAFCGDDDVTVPATTGSGSSTGTGSGSSTGNSTGTITGGPTGTTTGSTSSTTYAVKNASTVTFDNVCSYYYDGSDMYDFHEHGAMSPNDVSDTVTTNRSTINLGIVLLGTTCVVLNPYPITSGQHNILSLYDTTQVYCGKKKSLSSNTFIELERNKQLRTNPTMLKDFW